MTTGELRTIMLFKYIRDNDYIHYFVKDLKQVEKENNVCAYMVIPIYKEQSVLKTEKVKVPTKKIIKKVDVNKELDKVFSKKKKNKKKGNRK